MAPYLHLSTLGAPLLLTVSGEQIRFRTRKHLALLIRLAVDAGRRLTRDQLIDLLWPDAPTARARHSLAQAVSVLKAKVGPEHVQIQKATIALAPGVVDADVAHLEARDVEIRGPFLDGFEIPGAVAFEQWKDEWRAKLTPRVRDCLVRQMDAGRRIGDFASVERHAQALYDLDSLSEDAVRGLMEARALAGDRTNALKIYSRFAAQLTAELGAKPGGDLVRIATLLREGKPSVARSEAAAPSERLQQRFEAETLIGREREFAALYDSWLEVRHRDPRVVVLTGDPGIGKTTLTNAFASTCQMEGAVVARAQAYAAERELPFAVLGELVRQLAVQRAIRSAEPDALSELARIAPEIFDVFPGVPKPVDWAAEVTPLRLADAFLKAVTAAGDESPVILVVDDIHAADNASAAILHVVARKVSGTRVLLILAGRPSELRASDASAALTADAGIAALRAVELDALAPDAAAQLVRRLAADADPRHGAPPAERILRAGSGNPLAIELLTREWAAHGPDSLLRDLEALDTLPAASLGIPRAIRTVFERQTRRLDARTRSVLDLGALLGRRLADLSLYAAVDCPAGVAGEALSRLREEGILREVRGDLEFRNELLRAQAYYAIAAPARQHLHRRVAELLGERAPEDRKSLSLEIAWHFLRGGDVERALQYGLVGAEEALQVGAPYEAEQVLETLERQHCPQPIASRIHLILARSLLDQSKAERALASLDAAMTSGRLAAREVAEVARMRATGYYLVNQVKGESHYEAANEALLAAREVGDAELLAKALFEYARSGAEAGDEERVAVAQRQLSELLTDPSARQLSAVHYANGFCYYFFYEPAKAAASLSAASALLNDSRDAAQLSLVLNGLGNCQAHLCAFELARESYVTGLDLVKKIGDDSRASIILSNLCYILTTVGDYSGGIAAGLRSVDLGTKALNQPLLADSFLNLAEAYVLGGAAGDALPCLTRARECAARRRSWSTNVEFLCQTANVVLLMGDVTQALTLIGDAETTAWGRERAAPNAGLFERLRIFRAAHVHGCETARGIADRARAKFFGRNPLFYLNVLSAAAWLERSQVGSYTPSTAAELAALDRPDLAGYKALLKAQGFLN